MFQDFDKYYEELVEKLKAAGIEAPPKPKTPVAGELMPAVDVHDLKAFYRHSQERPNTQMGLGAAAALCQNHSDAVATGFRSGFLQVLVYFGLLGQWQKDGELHDAVFQAMTDFPVKYPDVGVENRGLGFEPQDFLRRVSELA